VSAQPKPAGDDALRDSYDRVAREYADNIYDELAHKPLDRELLDRFAREVSGRGTVCDMGCGPGHIARYLRDLGVGEVFGLDLSQGMLEQARRLNPDIQFRQGDMLALDLPDASLAGIAAFCAIVHFTKEQLPRAFGEMRRVLQPGGLLLLAFHVGEEVVHRDELWSVPVSLDFRFFAIDTVTAALAAAGLAVDEVIQREPYPEVEYPSRRGYVFARRQA
jgi:ubiquinone/menaquinone biosynthesis C-methylase UbiE